MSSSYSALRKSSAFTVFLLLAGFALFEGWFLELRWDKPWSTQSDGSLAQEYARALAHGQAYLLTPPDPRVLAAPDPLRSPYLLQDATLHHGRYYLYFSVVPFLVLPVPWLLLTGTYLPPAAAIFSFSLLGFIAYGGVLLTVSRRCLERDNAILTGLIFCGLVACSGMWPLMAEPEIYEIESAAGYACFAWSLFFLVRKVRPRAGGLRPARPDAPDWLSLAGRTICQRWGQWRA